MRMGLALLGYVFALGKPRIDGLRTRSEARGAVVICALALTGCVPAYSHHTETLSDSQAAGSKRQAANKAVPLPSKALLAPLRTPDCEGDGQQLASSQATASVEPAQPKSNADLALRIKLEYERECYRQAEARAREQLRKLQASAAETIKAVKQLEQDPR